MGDVRAIQHPGGSINVSELEAIFKNGCPIRGKSQEITPTFWQRIKLLFSKNFQIRAANQPVKSTFRGRLKALFSKDFKVRLEGRFIGRGFFEMDLVTLYGFTKRELDKLVQNNVLLEVTTTYKNAWRKTFVLPMHVELPLKGDKKK